MEPIVLFRYSDEVDEEFQAIFAEPWIYNSRTLLPKNSLVVARYSCLPFYKELEQDLAWQGSKLINSWEQHTYIADIENWYEDLKDFTPQTWFDWSCLPEGSFVLKGRTNSKKFQWNTQMFAKTREDVPRIANNLLNDQLISQQGLCVRKYVPLKRFDTSINGLPITDEWRVFFYKNTIISYGYYWSNFADKQPYLTLPGPALRLLRQVGEIASKKTNFFVVDIARTEDNDWIVIELNDGQMSGLSMNEPNQFYERLMFIVKNDLQLQGTEKSTNLPVSL